MHARYYDPATGQFISPDTLVPDPNDVLSYNRYLYARGNPLRYVDPSGHAECDTNWCWQNRWYNAHGFYSGPGGHWSLVGDASFADEGILDETVAEAGITWAADEGQTWTFASKSKVAAGILKFAQAFRGGAIRGLGRLSELLGAGVAMRLQQQTSAVCERVRTCAIDVTAPYEITWPAAYLGESALRVATTTVHEVAHAIDYASWNGASTFSGKWNSEHDGLTAYANCQIPDCVPELEKWAEAVTTHVYGPNYAWSISAWGPTDPRASLGAIRQQSALISNLIDP